MSISANVSVPADVTRSAIGFLQRLVGPAAEVADLLSDKIRFFRFKTAMKTAQIAEKIAKEKRLNVSQVPLKFLVPFLENCSLEDEPHLTQKWANLLSKAAAKYENEYLLYSTILKEMSGADARLLDLMLQSGGRFDATFNDLMLSIHGVREALTYFSKEHRRAVFAPKSPRKVFNRLQKLVEDCGDGLIWRARIPELPYDHDWEDSGQWKIETNKLLNNREIELMSLKRKDLVTMEYFQHEYEPFKEFSVDWIQITPLGKSFHYAVSSSEKK